MPSASGIRFSARWCSVTWKSAHYKSVQVGILPTLQAAASPLHSLKKDDTQDLTRTWEEGDASPVASFPFTLPALIQQACQLLSHYGSSLFKEFSWDLTHSWCLVFSKRMAFSTSAVVMGPRFTARSTIGGLLKSCGDVEVGWVNILKCSTNQASHSSRHPVLNLLLTPGRSQTMWYSILESSVSAGFSSLLL